VGKEHGRQSEHIDRRDAVVGLLASTKQAAELTGERPCVPFD
jgi:hypothetical protein